MALEDTLSGWTGPSSGSEREKQERTERMVREAINSHGAFDGCSLRVFAKGSYANNTNVRLDSDVDVAVECKEVLYWENDTPDAHPPGAPYEGEWTPTKLRTELVTALSAKFPGQLDISGSTAIKVNSSSARVDADVVPCFSFRHYFSETSWRDGTKIFKQDGTSLVNYPVQQLEKGVAKNNRTNYSYKKAVRLIKRIENAMVEDGNHKELPSYFIECLIYNIPDSIFGRSTWSERLRGILSQMYEALEGDEPDDNPKRWLEANECFYLFHEGQTWSRDDGRDFAYAAWNYLGFKT